jgi:hypothetical protein
LLALEALAQLGASGLWIGQRAVEDHALGEPDRDLGVGVLTVHAIEVC